MYSRFGVKNKSLLFLAKCSCHVSSFCSSFFQGRQVFCLPGVVEDRELALGLSLLDGGVVDLDLLLVLLDQIGLLVTLAGAGIATTESADGGVVDVSQCSAGATSGGGVALEVKTNCSVSR